MIMMGMLVLSGCEKPGSAMWPAHSFSQTDKSITSSPASAPISTSTSGKVVLALIAGVDGTKTFTGKIIEVAPVLLKHPPRYSFCRIQIVSDNGGKSGFFVPRATIITDLNGKDISGKWPGKGERVEIKYYTLKPGKDDRTYTVSIRYVPSDYVPNPAAPSKPATASATPGNAAKDNIFVGKVDTAFSFPPIGYFWKFAAVADNGEKKEFCILKNNTTIIQIDGKQRYGEAPRKGRKIEVKYSVAQDGHNVTTSMRYVSLDYVRQPTASSVSANAASSTSAPIPSLSFQLGEKIPAGKAVVYIYRPTGSGAGGAAMPFGIKANGKDAITLVQGGYYEYVTEPGNVEFTTFEMGFMAPSSQSSVTVDAKAGQTYYLKGTHGKGAMGRAHLESASPEVGAQEIANCKVIRTQ